MSELERKFEEINRLGYSSSSGDDIKVWGGVLWVGGGILSLFPLFFAIIQVYLLRNCVYAGIIQDFLTGGELVWVSAVFLITTMGNFGTGFPNLSKKSTKRNNVTMSMRRIVFLLSGLFVFLLCFATYFARKGQIVPPPTINMQIFSGVLWFLSMFIAFGLFIKAREV